VMFVLRHRGAAFPDEIAEATGLTYGTIKKVVSHLRGEGLVEDTGELRGQSRQVRLAQQLAVTLVEGERHGRDG
jgi:DNA-binding transcriptional ArsR family regulator